MNNKICAGNLPTVTIDFKRPVSNFEVRVAFTSNGATNCTVTIQDDKGDSAQVTRSFPDYEYLWQVYLPASDIRRVTFADDCWETLRGDNFYIDNVSFTLTSDITALDPFPDLTNGNNVMTSTESLAKLGKPVTGIAADRAARVVLRMRANTAGERLKLTILNDQGQPSGPAQGDGGLDTVESAATPGQAELQVTAVTTSQGPLAFAMYRPPPDFSRGGQDDGAQSRSISLKVESLDYPGLTSTTQLDIQRPPVVLVHGIWGDSSDWDTFTPLANDPRFFIRRATYNFALGNTISDSTPSYPAEILQGASTNTLGFSVNAPSVLTQIKAALSEFRTIKNAAAAQVDVVAHSMGGNVTRRLEYLDLFTDWDSFGVGNIHKLITVGTPHLGSPLATQLLQPNSTCMRNMLVVNGRVAISRATVAGEDFGGAVGDLQGDGFGGAMSGALQFIQMYNGQEVPTALIAGTMTQANLSGLNCTVCRVTIIRKFCSGDPLTDRLTAERWQENFGQASDGIVPLSSQLANLSGSEEPGVVHSAAVTALRIAGPSELEEQSNIPARAIQLLNTRSETSEFHPLP